MEYVFHGTLHNEWGPPPHEQALKMEIFRPTFDTEVVPALGVDGDKTGTQVKFNSQFPFNGIAQHFAHTR